MNDGASAADDRPDSAADDLADFEDLFENAPCGYLSAVPNGTIVRSNRTLCTWTGYGREQLVGRRFQDLLNIAGRIFFETHFAPLLRIQGHFDEVALDLVCATGATLPVLVNAVERLDADGSVRFIRITVFNARDRRRYEAELLSARQRLEELTANQEARIDDAIRERMQLEEVLRQSQKMEAVGQLTGGLAHDFNNLLTGISGNLELLRIRTAQGRAGSDLDRYIVAAQGATKRAAMLTHRLLAFSRRQTLDPKPTEVTQLIAELEDLLRRSVGPAVALEVIGTPAPWIVLIDGNQFESALLNLCLNARDAMPDGGRITIETANKWIDERAGRERDLPQGQYVALCVTDTGTGMSKEVIEHAFEPFFTTKPLGAGTGLGLSMVYGFARQSGGQVRIYSEVGEGTTVCIYLPRHFGALESEPEAPPDREATVATNRETILVVDDEPTVRVLVTEVLADLRYQVVEAPDGPSGLRILQSDRRIDLLVTDVGLPGGINGRQLADAGRTLRPGLRVLFITGYADNAVVSHGQLERGTEILTKPFAVEELARRVRALVS